LKVNQLVRIHGRWCGPNWTDGQNIAALAYKQAGGDFKGRCVDKLDCACRAHDKDCANSRGCSAKADRKLVRTALLVSLTTRNAVLSNKAKAIAAGITAASLTRRR
tara:strand:+ start:499 stop:816 length:318 start_codon:yes stop_codon:yes gene_type:complete